ncbi:hypothetical protein [Escherichia fergusonii]|uniref:hypothetical protein n=1 Tax=Escherichia fergusonii TaxID=564 RepID=UPI0035BE5011
MKTSCPVSVHCQCIFNLLPEDFVFFPERVEHSTGQHQQALFRQQNRNLTLIAGMRLTQIGSAAEYGLTDGTYRRQSLAGEPATAAGYRTVE